MTRKYIGKIHIMKMHLDTAIQIIVNSLKMFGRNTIAEKITVCDL